MKNFMGKDFLLETDMAKQLYHEHAAKMPIIDYHCHLIPKMVSDNHQFRSLTESILQGKTLQIGKNLKNGQRLFLTLCAILYIIGHILNLRQLLA